MKCLQSTRIKSLVNEELKQYFRPEFLNRLDEMIVFRQLTKTEVKEIADIILKEVFERLKTKEIGLQVTERFTDRVVDEGYNPSYGARPLRRAIMRLLEDSLAEKMLAGEIKEGDSAIVDVDGEGNVIVLNGKTVTVKWCGKPVFIRYALKMTSSWQTVQMLILCVILRKIQQGF
jgi:ATP-dependent Clp protease ATP-binding subunit ClpC